MVLNIIIDETRLFITAEKAPYLIYIEAFQPQELELHIQDEIIKTKPRAFEILKQIHKFNRDEDDLLKKINQKLSKPQYVIEGGYDEPSQHESDNDDSDGNLSVGGVS